MQREKEPRELYMLLSMELVNKVLVGHPVLATPDGVLLASGKDKLAEMLSMDSNAAKELMTSFLGNLQPS